MPGGTSVQGESGFPLAFPPFSVARLCASPLSAWKVVVVAKVLFGDALQFIASRATDVSIFVHERIYQPFDSMAARIFAPPLVPFARPFPQIGASEDRE